MESDPGEDYQNGYHTADSSDDGHHYVVTDYIQEEY